MELEVFDGWTIDRRLKQLRKIDENDVIQFVDFDSDLGQLVFEKKMLTENIAEMIREIESISKIIGELEKEQK